MLIIAERINSSRRDIAQAISSKDFGIIQEEARAQAQAGADYIDVNAGVFIGEEAEKLKWLIESIQEVSETPLCIDSPDPSVIKAVLPIVKHKPMINSISLEPERLEGLVPIVAENKTKVIALCQAKGTIAETSDEKFKLAELLVKKITAVGISLDDLYIDPLVYPISTNTCSAVATLEAIKRIMESFPGVHTVCGLTNVSYGLPARKLLNRSFLAAAITSGLDSVILDPTDKNLFATLKAALAINGRDGYCMEYIRAFRENKLV